MKQIIINNISTHYYITEDGKCYNSKTNKYLKGQVNYKNGYLSYQIKTPDGLKKRCYAHRLVANAFLDRPIDKKKDQINHIDGNKLNNNINNLEWCSAQENINHAIELELKKNKSVFCFTKEKKLIAEYRSLLEASKSCGIALSIIQQEVNKEIKTLSGGFYWSYEKELGKTRDYRNFGKAKKVNQYDLNGKYIMSYPSTGIAAKAISGNHSHIGECCRGKIKTYKNFIWRYAEDIVSTSSEN